MKKVIRRTILVIGIAAGIVLSNTILTKFPMQKLKITAQTTAEKFDISDQIMLYSFDLSDMGGSYTAVIKFIAVPDKSEHLFTRFGTGQYVYLGCSELQAKYDFVSFGRFLNIRLTLNATQTDLKLEDGTPFDVTRYSLKPVLTIERRRDHDLQ